MAKRKPQVPPDQEPPSDRTLPHDIQAERAVLGAVLLDNAAYHEALALVRPGHFYRAAHRAIFEAMGVLLSKRDGVADFLTLRAQLERAGTLEDAGGQLYLSEIVDSVPRSTNVRHYAGIVKDKALARRVIFACNKTLSSAFEGDTDAEGLLSMADRLILEARDDTQRPLVSLRETWPELEADLDYRITNRGKLFGIGTGFEDIDTLTLGWQRGDMIVLAARPSIGKTAMAMATAFPAAEAGGSVAIFEMEMKRRQLEYRLLSSLSGVPLLRILGGLVQSKIEYEGLSEAKERMAQAGLYISDTPRQTVSDIRAACRRLKAERGLDLVVVDYVQLLTGELDNPRATRTEQMTDISRKLKLMAGDLDVPLIVLSQLNRKSEQRDDPRPQMSDLRESGALEQDADLVTFLHRKKHKEGGPTEFIIEKARNGPTGTCWLSMTREIVRFEAGQAPAAPDPEPAAPKPASLFKRRRK